MRKLLTHYQLASICENRLKNRTISPIVRKRLACRILDEIHNITDSERANVLTCNLWQKNMKELQNLNLGNAIRRMAQKYR